MKLQSRRRWSYIVAALLFNSACGPMEELDGASAEAEAETGAHGDELRNGTPFSENQSTFVRIATSVPCTGLLVRNDWVLTANTCGAQPGTVIFRNGESVTVDRVIPHPESVYGTNAALLHLSRPLSVNYISQGYRRDLRAGLLKLGSAVRCFGYGRTSARSNPGSLNYAWLTVASAANNLYRFNRNASGQTLSYGDLGAVCLDDAGAGTVVIGTIAETAATPYGEGVTSHLIKPWFDAVLSGTWYHDPIRTVPAAGSDLHTFASDSTLVTVYRSTGNRVISRRKQGTSQSWVDLTSASTIPVLAASKPVGVRGLDGIEDVVFRAPNNRIYEIYRRTDGVYGWGDLLAGTSAPLAAGDPTAAVFYDGSYHVYYRGQDGHIHELTWMGPGRVAHYDLTNLVGARAAIGNPVVYNFGNEQHVVFKGTDNNVYELRWASGGWQYLNLTYLTRGPAPVGELSAYASGTEQGVVFRTSDGAIWAIWWTPSLGWTTESLTAGTGAPRAAGDPLGYFKADDGTHHVIYRSMDNHLWELFGNLTGAFSRGDLTAASGAPTSPYAVGTPSGTALPARASQHLVYRDFTGALHELRWPRN